MSAGTHSAPRTAGSRPVLYEPHMSNFDTTAPGRARRRTSRSRASRVLAASARRSGSALKDTASAHQPAGFVLVGRWHRGAAVDDLLFRLRGVAVRLPGDHQHTEQGVAVSTGVSSILGSALGGTALGQRIDRNLSVHRLDGDAAHPRQAVSFAQTLFLFGPQSLLAALVAVGR